MVRGWEQDKLGVKPRHTWDDAAAKFLEETSHKRTHEWDRSMLRWFQPLLGGKDLIDINRAVLDQVRAIRAKGVSTATVNRYMALVRTILRKACNEWEWIDRAPKVGMFRDGEGRVRSLSREEFTRLLAELPPHLADMAQFSVATGLRQANVTRLHIDGFFVCTKIRWCKLSRFLVTSGNTNTGNLWSLVWLIFMASIRHCSVQVVRWTQFSG